MRVYLGSDHAGFELKVRLAEWLASAGHQPVDCGPGKPDDEDDYPPYVMRAASAAVADPGSLGIVIGGWNEETARLARLHNDANVLSIGARMQPVEQAVSFAQVFIGTEFSRAPRHVRRLTMIADYERTGQMPPLPGG